MGKKVATALCLILLSITWQPAQAQEPGTCPTIVENAVQIVSESCLAVDRNEACYGYGLVEAGFREGAGEMTFGAPGDRVPIQTLDWLATHPMDEETGQWGVALMKVQADLPETVPGQAVTLLLTGDTRIEDASDEHEGYGPMQAFYFSTGLGEPACEELPPSSVLVSTPDGTTVTLNVNGLEVTLGSTVLMSAVPDNLMTITTLDGKVTVVTGPQTVSIPQGYTAYFNMEGNTASGMAGWPVPAAPWDVPCGTFLGLMGEEFLCPHSWTFSPRDSLGDVRDYDLESPMDAPSADINYSHVDFGGWESYDYGPFGVSNVWGEPYSGEGYGTWGAELPVSPDLPWMAPGEVTVLTGGRYVGSSPHGGWYVESDLPVATAAGLVPGEGQYEAPTYFQWFSIPDEDTMAAWPEPLAHYAALVEIEGEEYGMPPGMSAYKASNGIETWYEASQALAGPFRDDFGGFAGAFREGSRYWPQWGAGHGPQMEYDWRWDWHMAYPGYDNWDARDWPVIPPERRNDDLWQENYQNYYDYDYYEDADDAPERIAFWDVLPGSAQWVVDTPDASAWFDGAIAAMSYDRLTHTTEYVLIEGHMDLYPVDSEVSYGYDGLSDGRLAVLVTLGPDGEASSDVIPFAEALSYFPPEFFSLNLTVVLDGPIDLNGEGGIGVLVDTDGNPETGATGNPMFSDIGADLIAAIHYGQGEVGFAVGVVDGTGEYVGIETEGGFSLAGDGNVVRVSFPLGPILEAVRAGTIQMNPASLVWRAVAVDYAIDGFPKDIFPELGALPTPATDRESGMMFWPYGIPFGVEIEPEWVPWMEILEPEAEPGEAPAEESEAGPTGGAGEAICTATLTANSNIRSGAGTDNAVLTTLAAGTQVEVTGTNAAGDWLHIRYDGESGWVAGFLAELSCPSGAELPVEE